MQNSKRRSMHKDGKIISENGMLLQNSVNYALNALNGKVAWNAKKGVGSFITMEFGLPHLVVKEPRTSTKAASKKVLEILARRSVFVHGEWHLWIYCCHWTISSKEVILASDQSANKVMTSAIKFLDGQILKGVQIQASSGSSRFEFDLGGELNTFPGPDAFQKQWMIFTPDEYVLCYGADGKMSYCKSDTKDADMFWFDIGP